MGEMTPVSSEGTGDTSNCSFPVNGKDLTDAVMSFQSLDRASSASVLASSSESGTFSSFPSASKQFSDSFSEVDEGELCDPKENSVSVSESDSESSAIHSRSRRLPEAFFLLL